MPISQPALEEAIRAAIPCDHLEVIDDSNGCGENYAVLVVSSAFEGKTTLNRHRFSVCSCFCHVLSSENVALVNEVLKEEISQMHAFSQVRQWVLSSLSRCLNSSAENIHTKAVWSILSQAEGMIHLRTIKKGLEQVGVRREQRWRGIDYCALCPTGCIALALLGDVILRVKGAQEDSDIFVVGKIDRGLN